MLFCGGSGGSSKLLGTSPDVERAVREDLRLASPTIVPGGGSEPSQSGPRSASRSLIDLVRVGDIGVRGVRRGSSICGGSRGDRILGGGSNGELVVTAEEAVGVAEEALETSHGAGDVKTAGEAGFRYPSRLPFTSYGINMSIDDL